MDDQSTTRSGIEAGMTSELAFHHLLLDGSAVIQKNLERFQVSPAEETVHKARVALRRLTTMLDAFRPIMKKSRWKAWRSEAKTIFRALGEVRDADVFLAALPDAKRSKKLVTETAWLREKVRRNLKQQDAAGFPERLEQAFREGTILRKEREGMLVRGRVIEDLAAEALDGIWTALRQHGTDLAQMSAKERHGFRKNLKSFRYLSEDFAPLFPHGQGRDVEDLVKALQDDLGALNDMTNARKRKKEAVDANEEEAVLDRAREAWVQLSALRPWWQPEAQCKQTPETDGDEQGKA